MFLVIDDNDATAFPAFTDSAGDNTIDLRGATQEAITGVQRVRIGQCLVDLVARDQALHILDGHLCRPAGTGALLVASANLDHITHFGTRADGEALDVGRMDDWLVLLDGAPLVAAARRLTGVLYPRLTGSDLLPEMLSMAQARRRRVAVLGGAPAIRAPFAEVVRARWPQLDLDAHLTPPREQLTDPAGSLELQAELASRRPELLIVALGKPLQERWMAHHARATGAQVVVAFGAAPDFLAGAVPRAPGWLREHGLEWAYRLWLEPRRLGRRYLLQGPSALRLLRRDAVILPPVSASVSSPPLPGAPPTTAIPASVHEDSPDRSRP
jgi:N-acetylglucosaminyldiphosphoundecaprenol N-acetyl-beta-D-mannosaminyltransferase